ncbi:3599_t:CDS:2 [Funneliformis caledonium]|uniref:3599_t:CDS:1 n=2 Tax=Funneliformis TaxID=1117308 RepID=A0A9N9H6Z9_9GLOM|nr:10018_t:CDS:2 [Funneliformis mosseae]CAG8663497.1 3599_t:CDS:2 [Funneliformis caledonium]
MEDAPYDYKILTRPRASPKNKNCSYFAEQESKSVEGRSIFEDALQAYEELKNRESSSEDWKYDEGTGYYYCESTKMYAFWDADIQDWKYFNNKIENYQGGIGKFDETNKDEEDPSNSDKESENSTESTREEGQLSDSEACGTASSSYENDTNGQDQHKDATHRYPIPLGYKATVEVRYYFNPENNVWFDVHSGVYSVYDESTQTYTPIDPTSLVYSSTSDDAAIEQGEPGSDATLRLVVIESGILKAGHLVLVDANGISMGRDRWDDRRLRLAEMPTSKHHCQIFCSNNNEEGGSPTSNSVDAFFIVDIGSQNGTFVNSQRLSESKMSSKPYQLNHMDEVVVGSTKFQVHLHKQWTCDICTVTEGKVIDISQKNDGISNNMNKSKQKNLEEFQRREELNRLKRKYMGSSNINQKQKKYVDRAALRREIHPDNGPVKKDWEDIAQVSAEEAKNLQTKIGSDNKGNKLLQKMGWKEGQGLGRHGTGILDPVQFITNEGRVGLGAGGKKSQNSTTESLQEATRRVAKERFIDLFQ